MRAFPVRITYPRGPGRARRTGQAGQAGQAGRHDTIRAMSPNPPAPHERLSGSIERVTFHSEQSGFCVLRVQVRGQRDVVTVIGNAAAEHPVYRHR